MGLGPIRVVIVMGMGILSVRFRAGARSPRVFRLAGQGVGWSSYRFPLSLVATGAHCQKGAIIERGGKCDCHNIFEGLHKVE